MFNKALNHLEEWLISFLMAAATLVIFVAVVHRYLATVPYVQDVALKVHMSWAQELCIILFVWMCKFGAAYGVRTGIHVGVDVVINRMQPKNRARFVIFGLLAGALFTGAIAVMGGTFVWDNGAHHAFLDLIGQPMPDDPTQSLAPVVNYTGMACWARMHGLVILEVTQHLQPGIADTAIFYRAEMIATLKSIGLDPHDTS